MTQLLYNLDLEAHGPWMIIMDPPWPSWTQHDHHGTTMSLILNLQSVHEPNQNFIEPHWSSWTLLDPHGPSMAPWTIHDPHGLSLICMDPT